MSRPVAKPRDDLLDAILEDERAALIAELRARGQADDETSWLSLA